MSSTATVTSGFQAALAGFRRVLRAPTALVGLWLLGVAAAFPATWLVIDSLQGSFGKSRIHESMTTSFNSDWFDEFSSSADGLEATFDPTRTGAGAVYDNLERWLSGNLLPDNATLLVTLLLFSVAWLFLQGGVLDRYARPGRPIEFGRFFRSSGHYFFRLVRLAALSALFYWLVYRLSVVMLEAVEHRTRDATTESSVAMYSLIAWFLTALLLSLVHICFGFAKAATVVEQRRSMLVAAARGLGFVLVHPAKAISLYLYVLLASGLTLGAFALIAPGPGQSTQRTVVVAFLISQLFLFIRVALRLGLLAGQVALFQSAVGPLESQTDPAIEPAIDRPGLEQRPPGAPTPVC